jgi:hypothetical protein
MFPQVYVLEKITAKLFQYIADYIVGCADGYNLDGTPVFNNGSCPYPVEDCPFRTPIPGAPFVCAPLNYVTVASCINVCKSSESANISTALIAGANEVKIFDHLLTDIVLPFLRCELVTNTFKEAQDIICVELV